MLNKTGFGIKYFITYEDFADFKKNLDGNFAELRNGLVRRFIKGLFFSIFFPVYFLARKILWELKYGGLIFIIAKK
ncbi:hypothetical protein HY612_01700 [Candidatus Roizmanbacteria bacterium]|nr:hypothetical protein [Candidatus Roizmanbacteria bacterium]